MRLVKAIGGAVITTLFLTSSSEAGREPGCKGRRDHKLADAGKTAMPFVALGSAIYHLDWKGAALSQALAHGLYALNTPLSKKVFHKKRPCGCHGAYPSGHMLIYASTSSFMHYRYGWQWGLPAYAATIVFAANRVHAKAHSWLDMVGTFAPVNLLTWLVTPRFPEKMEIIPEFRGSRPPKDPETDWVPMLQITSQRQMAGITLRF